MTDPTKVATGLADLAMKVKDKADQAESNQSTCKILAGHIRAVIPVIQDLEDKICEEDERLQNFVDDMGSLLVETDKLIDKIKSRNMATRLLKASSDERDLTSIEKRLAQMSQRATFQILTIVTEIKSVVSGEGVKAKKKKAFRPIELKLLSTQNVDLRNNSYQVLMRTTGEIVFVLYRAEDDGPFLYLYMIQQGGSLNKESKIAFPFPFDAGHRPSIHCLLIKIQWREYLAISCLNCYDIKLVDLETNEVTTAYTDGQMLGMMCRGWHKIYVQVYSGYLELDCSSTKFTKIRQIETERCGMVDMLDLCYVSPPHNLIVAVYRLPDHGERSDQGEIHATCLYKPTDTAFKLEMGAYIRSITYSSRHDALLAVNDYSTVWALNPSTGGILQTIDVPEISCPANAFIRDSQFVMIAEDSFRDFKIHNFSLK